MGPSLKHANNSGAISLSMRTTWMKRSASPAGSPAPKRERSRSARSLRFRDCRSKVRRRWLPESDLFYPGAANMQKIVPCLWYDGRAEEAAKLYTSLFENSKINEVTRYGEAGPG